MSASGNQAVHILKRVFCKQELQEVIKHIRRKLRSTSVDRQWHMHRALNTFRYFQPILQNNIWVDGMPPSFCFEQNEIDNTIHIEMCFVDEETYSFEDASTVLNHWMFAQDDRKRISLQSFPEYLYKEGMFPYFELECKNHYPCYWLTHDEDLPAIKLPDGLRIAPLCPTDARRIADSWPYSQGELTVQNFQKLWSANVNSYQVLTEDNKSIGHLLWNRGVLEDLYICRQYGRKRISLALGVFTIQRLTELGCRPLGETGSEDKPSAFAAQILGFTVPTYSYYLQLRRKPKF